MTENGPGPGVSRRGLLRGAAAAGGLAVGVGGTLGAEALRTSPTAADDSRDTVDLSRAVPFYGAAEQAGITTPPQRYTVYMTFDLTTPQRTDLQSLLARWSGAIAELMAGRPVGQVEPARASAVGADTGEALDLAPASLTVTVGLGPKVFTDAYGLTAQAPPLLRDLRQLPSDALDPRLTG
jgi:deferrochelatase/peroxidase EfeB